MAFVQDEVALIKCLLSEYWQRRQGSTTLSCTFVHRDTRGTVCAYGKVTKEFPIKNGVRQMFWHLLSSTSSLTKSLPWQCHDIQAVG